MFCPYCGYQVTEEMSFCTNCGKKLPETEKNIQPEPEPVVELAVEPEPEPIPEPEPEPELEPEPAQEPQPETLVSFKAVEFEEEELAEPEPAAESVAEAPSMVETQVTPLPVGEQTLPEFTLPSFEAVPSQPVEPAAAPPSEAPTSLAQPVQKTGFGFESQQPPKQRKVKQPREKKTRNKPKNKPVMYVLIGLGAIAVICLVLLIALAVIRPPWLPLDWLPEIRFGKRASTEYLVVLPQRDDTVEIELATRKESVPLMEDVSAPTLIVNSTFFIEDGQRVGFLNNPADFIPGTDLVLMKVVDEDETSLYLNHSDKDPENLIFNSDYPFSAYANNDGTIVIIERRDSSSRAYVSKNLEEAERVYKADTILYLYGHDQFIGINTDSTDEGEMVTYTLADLNGDEIGELYDGQVPIEREITGSEKYMALSLAGEEGDEIIIIDMNSQKEIASNDDYVNILRIGSAETGDLLYFIGENEDGLLSVETSLYGQWETILEDQIQIWLDASYDGNQLAMVTYNEDDEEYQVLLVDVKSGTTSELYTSDQPLSLMNVNQAFPEYFLVSEQTEDSLILHSFDFQTGDFVDIFEENAKFNGLIRTFGKWIFVPFIEEDGDEDILSNLWACTPDGENGFLVMEDWYFKDVSTINTSGTALIMAGREDQRDDLELLWVELAEDGDIISLDDEGTQYQNVNFMPDERSILYTIRTGPDEDEIEVRTATIDDDPEVDTVYDEAYLSGVAWSLYWDYRNHMNLFTVASFEGSASRMLRMDETTVLTMPADEDEVQAKLRLTPGYLYSIYVTADEDADFDPTILVTAMDDESVLDEGNYGEDVNESVFFASGDETDVLLTIFNEEDASSDFEFEVWTVSIEPMPAEVGSTIEEEISEDDARSSPASTWYEDIYAVEIEAGSYVTFELEGNEDLEYIMYILDEDTNFIEISFNDTGGYSFIETTFDEDGVYYVIILELLGEDGILDPDVDHSYTLTID